MSTGCPSFRRLFELGAPDARARAALALAARGGTNRFPPGRTRAVDLASSSSLGTSEASTNC
eukprot:3476564-Pyramimonas_sp.AAC.1